MSIGSELEKLKQLLDAGVLSKSEFEIAKSKLLNTLGPENSTGTGVNQMARAANRWVDLQWVAYGIGLVGAVLVLVLFVLPLWKDIQNRRSAFDAEFNAAKQNIEKSHEDLNSRTKKFDGCFSQKEFS